METRVVKGGTRGERVDDRPVRPDHCQPAGSRFAPPPFPSPLLPPLAPSQPRPRRALTPARAAKGVPRLNSHVPEHGSVPCVERGVNAPPSPLPHPPSIRADRPSSLGAATSSTGMVYGRHGTPTSFALEEVRPPSFEEQAACVSVQRVCRPPAALHTVPPTRCGHQPPPSPTIPHTASRTVL